MEHIAYSVDYPTPTGIRRVTSTDREKIIRISDAVRKIGKWSTLTMRHVR